MLGASAWLLASCLRLDSLCGFLLAVYLLAWGEVVVSALALSAVHGFARPGLLACLATWLGAAIALWWWRGRPRPVAIRPRLAWLRTCLGRSRFAVLAITLTAGYVYLVALGLFTPQNDGDPLAYQLTRAAVWRQEEAIGGLIGVSVEPRLDVNPIVAEVGQATTLVLAGGERFVWLVQLAAVAALTLSAFALARRVGISPSSALFGAMIVPALPVVATQAITGYNDLVAASFVVSATVFVLGRSRAELIPLALAVSLAVGTKFTTPFVLPVVALVGALGQPLRRWPSLLVTGAGAAMVGAGWYVVNLVRTGEADGGLASFAGQEPVRTLPSILTTAQELLLDSIERPGTAGPGVVVFILIGVTIAGAGAYAVARGGTTRSVAIAGFAVVATPFLVIALWWTLRWLFSAMWDAFGETARADQISSDGLSFRADGIASWYGPLAAVIGISVVAVTARNVRRGTVRPAALGLAVAPWIGIVILAVGVTYDPWRGRFLVAVWVMSVAVWGLLARHSAVAASLVAVTAVTFALSLAQYFGKPSGIDVLTEFPGPSIWGMERWRAQTALRGSSPREIGEKLVIREVERKVPDDAPIAVSVWGNDFLFPYFGEDLGREVRLIGPQGKLPRDANWLVAAPEAMPIGCADAWRTVASHRSGWRLYRRTGSDTCISPRDIRSP